MEVPSLDRTAKVIVAITEMEAGKPVSEAFREDVKRFLTMGIEGRADDKCIRDFLELEEVFKAQYLVK